MLLKTVGRFSPIWEYKPSLHRWQTCRSSERGFLPMITLSYEALIALVALCGGAGYMLGRDIQKAKK